MLVEIALTLLVVVLSIKLVQRPRNFPPGPRGLPLIGYSPFVSRWDFYPHKAMAKMSKLYGPVVGFFVGPNQPMIAVCSHEAIKEAMHNEDLNGRPTTAVIQARTYDEKLGIMFVDGALWQEQRRFTMRHLRDLGFGKTSIEDQMMDEVRDLINDVEESAKSDSKSIVDMSNTFQVSVVNVLWAIVAGRRYQRNDPKFLQLLDSVNKFFRNGNVVRGSIPLPRWLLKKSASLRRLVGLHYEYIEPMIKFIEENVNEHKLANKCEGQNDFIDVYLKEMEKQANNSSLTTFTDKQLVSAVLDFFAAGAESTSNSIGFAIIHLIRNPAVQKKMQAELDCVCGENLPTLADRSNLPYTEAVLAEAQRCSSIAPFTVPHAAIRDTKLQGYSIPQGSIVMLNLDAVLNDEEYWNDPEVFQPERHLNEDGTKFIRNERFYPFGAGKRMCSGESLARNNYYLFVAALVKKFDFRPVPDGPLPSLLPLNGFTLGYQGFKALVTPRN